ncbi:uncharacterized protein LOC141596645 isoform X3 [Silene latifolia]|uniref:uncharacterized protein LOC141596645 isoform X3 n=1 Tax=Silene latifolia TaxID=37657 RepID=UPI003D77E02E
MQCCEIVSVAKNRENGNNPRINNTYCFHWLILGGKPVENCTGFSSEMFDSSCSKHEDSITHPSSSPYTLVKELLLCILVASHCRSNPKFNSHKYIIIQALEDDFRQVVGISWYLWVFVIIFFLLNVGELPTNAQCVMDYKAADILLGIQEQMVL